MMAEQALKKIEEKGKQTMEYYKKVREDTPEMETDPQIEKEIIK